MSTASDAAYKLCRLSYICYCLYKFVPREMRSLGVYGLAQTLRVGYKLSGFYYTLVCVYLDDYFVLGSISGEHLTVKGPNVGTFLHRWMYYILLIVTFFKFSVENLS